MDPVETYKHALEIYKRDPAQWTVLYGIMLLISAFTFGLGTLLLPNVMRATRDALREERPPDIAAVFQFDDLLEDAIAAGGVLVVIMVASTFMGPLAFVAHLALGLAPLAVTEDNVGGIDALQASVGFLQKEPAPLVTHWLISALINTPLACCFFPLFVTVPITGIAQWLFYDTHRSAILEIEDSAPPA